MKKIFHVALCLVTAALILLSLGAAPTIKGSYPYFDLTAFNGIATGSLPSCAAGVANGEGWFAYDSTTKTMKFCNATSWTSTGNDLSAVASDIKPSVDVTYNLGSSTKAWSAVFALSVNDQSAQTRINWAVSQPITYYGDGSDGAGANAHKFANLQAITASDTRYIARFYRDNLSNQMAAIDTNGNFRNITTGFAAPMVHGTSNTTAKDIEVGSGAMTAGELAVTFSTSFGAAPVCVCTHVNTTNTNACNIKSGSTPSTTGVTFAVTSGGTDVVHWNCVGTR